MTSKTGPRLGASGSQWAGGGRAHLTAYEYVLDVLRRGILSGEIEPGTRLVQSDVAEQLNVSTTPVREALRELTSEGLVRFDPHRGGVVQELGMEELDEIFELRKVLEPFSLRRAADRITDEELTEAESIIEAMDDESDLGAWVELNRRFHMIHHEAAGSPRLIGIMTPLQYASAQYVGRAVGRHPETRARAQQEHREIIAGLRAHDTDRLEAVILEHISIPHQMITPDELEPS